MIPQYPILDSWGAVVLVTVFTLLLLSERAWPLRRRVQTWWKRMFINMMVGAPAFVVMRILLIPAVVAVAAWGEQHDFGLTRWLGLPGLAAGIVALLVLDYTMYLWHSLNHRVPILWRFHNVHHTDLDLDISTAFRFHFGELLLSVGVRSAQVALAGASPAVALVYEVLLEASTQFHHSNLRLPLGVERILARFIMTPRGHGIHHSVVPRETNSNYSNFLVVWDRLHRTLRLDVPQERIVVGVPAYQDERELTVSLLLLMPFRRQRQPPPTGADEQSNGSQRHVLQP